MDSTNEGFLMKTTNGGEYWSSQTIAPFFNPGYPEFIFFTDENYGWIVGNDYSSEEGVILKTTNGGNNWIIQSTPPGIGWAGEAFFINGTTGWVVFYYASAGPLLLKTTDGGLNWLSQTLPVQYPGSIYFVNQSIGWIFGTTSQ